MLLVTPCFLFYWFEQMVDQGEQDDKIIAGAAQLSCQATVAALLC